MARMVFFICFVLYGVLAAESPERGLKCSLFERRRILFGGEIPRQGRFGTPDVANPHISAQNPLAVIVLNLLDGGCSIILVSF